MELKNLPWYGQLLVFLVIGAIFLGIFYYVHYQPTQTQIDAINTQRVAVEEEIREAEKSRSKLQRLEEELEKNKQTLDSLKSVLPEISEISDIIKRMQALASASRIRINTITPKKESSRDIYVEWPIQFTADGSYHNLAIFFDQVSRMKKIFTITGLSIKPLGSRTATSADLTINASFVATTYSYREQPAKQASAKKKGARKKPASTASEEVAI